MSIEFVCADPSALLKSFNDRIAQAAAEGKITAWIKKGDYYTHRADRWSGKAWLKASTVQGALRFNIVPSQGEKLASADYAYYHGHLIETFLNHFDEKFTDARASAMPRAGDSVGAAAA